MASTHRSAIHRLLRHLVAGVVLGMLLLAPSGVTNARDDVDPLSVSYLLDRGRVRTIAIPGAVDTGAGGINNRGEIVGKYEEEADSLDHGFFRDRKGRYHQIDVPGAVTTQASKLNGRGQIVGAFNTEICQNPDQVVCPGAKGFLLERGRFTTIAVPDAVYTQALGINNAGVVVGEYLDEASAIHGFRWQRGRFDTIDVPGSSNTSVSDINDQGDVIGVHGDVASDIDGFLLLHRPGADVESFDAPAGSITLVFGMNNRRQIVGVGGEIDLSVSQGFLLTGGAEGEFTPVEIRGTDRTEVFDINDRGQIVAVVSRLDGAQDGNRDGQPALPIMTPG
jgi:hypothetical protein